MLSCFSIDPNNNTDSEVKIPKLVFAYNAAEHASTNQTPFEMTFGFKTRVSLDLIYNFVIILDRPVRNNYL